MTRFSESVVEDAALDWLEALGWRVAHGPDLAPETPGAERTSYGEVVLARRLRDALGRLNPALPTEAVDDAFRKLTRPEGVELIGRNRALRPSTSSSQKRRATGIRRSQTGATSW